METAPTSIEVLLRPTLGQSDEPSDLRGSLSPTSVYSTWQSPGGHPSNYEPGATSPNFSDRANHDERTPYSVLKYGRYLNQFWNTFDLHTLAHSSHSLYMLGCTEQIAIHTQCIGVYVRPIHWHLNGAHTLTTHKHNSRAPHTTYVDKAFTVDAVGVCIVHSEVTHQKEK